MATEGAVHVDKEHVWHVDTIASFVDPNDGLLIKTPFQDVDLANKHLALYERYLKRQ